MSCILGADGIVVDIQQDKLRLRLHLASHLAKHLREALHSQKGYTCTVGVSTNKLLSKLVGNLHKPNEQTTLLPPYTSGDDEVDNVTLVIDNHEVGKIPGIGFKLAQKLRAHVLQRPPKFDNGLVYGGTKETVLVGDVRKHSGMSPETLEHVLGGAGTPSGIGSRVWDLLNGCDDTEVGQARDVPRQISIEDSYGRLDTINEVVKALRVLTESLLRRIQIDLLENDDEDNEALGNTVTDSATNNSTRRRWLAFPKTVRLSTRPRLPQNPDGRRNRSFARISRSAPIPNFVFSLKDDVGSLANRLVVETLIPLFRKMHPEKSGWNLSLVNVCAADIVDAASEKGGPGRDIAKMFRRQDDVLKQWRIQEDHADVEMEEETLEEHKPEPETKMPEIKVQEIGRVGSEDVPTLSQEGHIGGEDIWESEDEDMVDEDGFRCEQCGALMPIFAMVAHSRWHTTS